MFSGGIHNTIASDYWRILTETEILPEMAYKILKTVIRICSSK